MLLTTTVHLAIDYRVVAWMPLKIPTYFTDKLGTIDYKCARAALGALNSTPSIFLDHDFKLTTPKVRLQEKIVQYMAKALTKPQHHPAHAFITQPRTSNRDSHHTPYNRLSQNELCVHFDEYTTQPMLDTSTQLRSPPNYKTLICQDEDRAKLEYKHLKPSCHHLVIYTDGSRLPKGNMAAAAWSQLSKRSLVEGIGPAQSWGSHQAEYRGLQLGLTLALREASTLTHIATIILENQLVIKDMKSQQQSLTSLLDKQRTFTILMYLECAFPDLTVMIRWGPGHKGVRGNKIVDKLAQETAKKSLSDTSRRPPRITAFRAVIKEWVREKSTALTNDQRKRLGHEHQALKHTKSLRPLSKASISATTQLRSGHPPLNHHLHKYQRRHKPGCECDSGIETNEHFLSICPRYISQIQGLLTSLQKLKIKTSKECLRNPEAHKAISEYCNATWFLDGWV